MLDDRPLLAARFRQLADQYEKIANPLEQSCTAIDENAGKLTIAAFHRGYLSDVPSLGDLVEWVENPPSPFPLDPQAELPPCASNLFRELCGNHIIPGKKQPEGYWRIHSDRTHGGIMPSVFPDILPGLKYCVPGEDIERRKQRALVCRWLATKIESSLQKLPTTTANDERDKWWHGLTEQRPAEFQHGPITGQKKEICTWMGEPPSKNMRR